MLVVKIEFYTLDFLSCWLTVLFLLSLFLLFFLHSSFSKSKDPLFFLCSSFSRSTNPNQTPRTNPFVLHSPHQQTPSFFIQSEPSPPPRFSPSHCLEPSSWFPFSIFAGFVFISLLHCGLLFLISLLGSCFCRSLYKTRASKARFSTSNSSVLDSKC